MESFQKKLYVDNTGPGERTGMFGIFLEDLNHAADGGLYAEMLQNRSFEYSTEDNQEYHPLYGWEPVENEQNRVHLVIDMQEPVFEGNPHYLVMKTTGENAGIANAGYNTGLSVQLGECYHFSCYARCESDSQTALRCTVASEKKNLGSIILKIQGNAWRKYEGDIVVSETSHCARLEIVLPQAGSVALDMVSLFPQTTFCRRKNGMRNDLGNLLADMKPQFLRFPGGCLIHDGSLDENARDSMYRWKNTLGPVWQRRSRKNPWGYNQSLGLGFYEYFLFAEDLGAIPIPVLPGGCNPHKQNYVSMEDLQPWIDDALDLIEFANGDEDTEWGSVRSMMGHPEPFGMEYIGIGNEEVGVEFFERYKEIHHEIRKCYPDMKIICTSGPNAAGTEYERGWKCAIDVGSDLVDEHFYQTPEWFIANHRRYDCFSGNHPKVFLGEYASWGNTWYHALAEAVFMMGLERNAGSVELACYAPLLANIDYVDWKPDMIYFDNHRICPTANYYVQKLFMHNQGSKKLKVHTVGLEADKNVDEPLSGMIRLCGNETVCRYSTVRIINDDTGEVISYNELLVHPEEDACIPMRLDWKNYTITCKAEELKGKKGFEIRFAWENNDNYRKWVIGGWQNYDITIGHKIRGMTSDLSQGLFQVEKNRIYDLKLKVQGRRIATWIDGQESLQAEDKQLIIEPLYYSSCIDEKDGAVIIKAANLQNKAVVSQVEICGWNNCGISGRIYTMCYNADDENTLEHPDKVLPIEKTVDFKKGDFCYSFPPLSLTIFRLYKRG